MRSEEAKRKILVLRYRFIGDTILTVPFLRNLRRAEPEAYIAWVVAPGSSDVIQGIPYVDELIYWDPVTIHADCRGTHRTFAAKVGFIRDLRARRFQKVYVLKRSLSSAIIALLTGAPERIGFNTEGRGFLLTGKVRYRHNQHEVQNFLDVLRTDGVEVEDDYLEIWTTHDEEKDVEALFEREGVVACDKLIAIHPFAAVAERGWPMENFAELAQRLAQGGYLPIILGGPGDREKFVKVRHMFGTGVVDLVGKSKLRTTIALLKKCLLFVGNDSGVMHLAAASGIPLVALFGPQSPLKFGPWSRKARVIYKRFPCSPCKQKFFQECKPSNRLSPECVEAIAVEEILREVANILKDSVGRESDEIL